MRKTLMKGGGAVAAVLAAMFVAGLIPPGGANAGHEPANKTSAAGASAEVLGANDTVVLLSERVKTSLPTDLILGVTLECVITTELTTVGNDKETGEGKVRVWIEIDGVVVPVSSDDTTEPGKVTFCNRFEERETTLFDDTNATIRTLNRTGTANGFNWMALNVGSATHEIVVKAEFTTTAASEGSEAIAAVGKRTLIVEPTKAANDEAVTALG